jgi:hypothetical protein
MEPEAKPVPLTDIERIDAGRRPPTEIKLSVPIEFGGDTISVLVLRPSARAFRGFSLPMTAEGGVLFQPYELAALGLKLAGQPAQLLDKMDARDMAEVARAAMDFFVPGQPTGKTA